jgi:hypothetical protein
MMLRLDQEAQAALAGGGLVASHRPGLARREPNHRRMRHGVGELANALA